MVGGVRGFEAGDELAEDAGALGGALGGCHFLARARNRRAPADLLEPRWGIEVPLDDAGDLVDQTDGCGWAAIGCPWRACRMRWRDLRRGADQRDPQNSQASSSRHLGSFEMTNVKRQSGC